MRTLVLMLLLAVSPAANALGPPSFIDAIRACVNTTVKYTEFATLAKDSKDSEKGAFFAFVQQEADEHEGNVKQMFLNMGELAWLSREHDVHQDAMEMYDKCYNKLGTKT